MAEGPGSGGELDLLRHALTPLFGELSAESIDEIAAAGEWLDIEGGRRLICLGDPADSLYLLVRGRLRASRPDADGAARTIGEVAVGESVGEMALLGGGSRNADIDAIRDSRLLRLGIDAFRDLATRHPEFLWNLSRMVVQRMERSPAPHRELPSVRTIAIAGTMPAEARERFVRRLAAALEPHGTTAVLDPGAVRSAGGDGGDAHRLAAWLHEQELRHRFVLVPTEPADREWTELIFRQADRILVVCPADGDPQEARVERSPRPAGEREVRVRRELVLVHPDGDRRPDGTARWLDAMTGDRVHHVRDDRDGDYQRVARFLAGRSVALVFAGGGAKGFAHIGVLQALREESIPVDMVGGTSIGAILAATIAMDWGDDALLDVFQRSFVETNPANDYRVPPIVSIVKGRKMERLLQRFFDDTQIEDLWLPFYCVSSNLSASEKAVHTRGTVWRRLRASASIAGVFPPTVIDGQLHVDGGTFDNMPVGTARDLSAGHVIACDIQRFTGGKVAYDEVPPTRTLLADAFLFRRGRRVPGLISTMMQTTFLAGLDRARTAANDADLFLEPRTSRIRFLDWSALNRVVKLGYTHAKERFADPEVRERLETIRRPGC